MRPGILQTTWAVFLGCTTSRRLADEMGITMNAAVLRLRKASRAGLISKDGPRRFFVPDVIAEDLA